MLRCYKTEIFLQVGLDLDAVFKFLDTAGNKLDYRRYGEVLLEILIAGGLLAPGGTIQPDADKTVVQTRACIFQDAYDLDRTKAWDSMVFVKLMRRYKYLEKMLTEEMSKILVYLKGFSEVSCVLAELIKANSLSNCFSTPGTPDPSGSNNWTVGVLWSAAFQYSPGHHQRAPSQGGRRPGLHAGDPEDHQEREGGQLCAQLPEEVRPGQHAGPALPRQQEDPGEHEEHLHLRGPARDRHLPGWHGERWSQERCPEKS